MKQLDHEDLVRWRTYVGLPRLSPHVTKAAKRISENQTPGFNEDSFDINQQLVNKTKSSTQVKYQQVQKHNRPFSAVHPSKVPFRQSKQTKPKRVCSAPPTVNGYTVYQQRKPQAKQMPTGLAHKIEDWANTASNYDKEVVFNMLKKIQPNQNIPASPNNEGYFRNVVSPFSDYQPSKAKPSIQRKTHSSPEKSMAGLLPSSIQKPVRDQRVYRLMGQDHRLKITPREERQINSYMDQQTQRVTIPLQKSYQKHTVPICSYLLKRGSQSQDYQCKVSFFQSVRSPFKNHFVIHPDFTSEGLSNRKLVSHNLTHFKY